MDIEGVVDVLVVGLILILPAIPTLLGVYRDERDMHRILKFLGSKDSSRTWLSTWEISLSTSIPGDRVRKLCGRHNGIERSEGQREMWRLAE